jgi:hypothetical protein
MEIVGVVGDAVYRSPRETVPATIYTPLSQLSGSSIIDTVSLSVRASTGAPAALTKAVATAIDAINPELTLTERPLADQLNASLTQERIVAQLAGFFGMLALLLAALGLYGVTAGAVARRASSIEPAEVLREQ